MDCSELLELRTTWSMRTIQLIVVVRRPLVVAGLIVTWCLPALAAPPKWETLFVAKPSKAGIKPLPENGPLQSLTMFNLTAEGADPFHLGQFAVNGDFGLNNGVLQRTAGKNAIVRFAKDVGDFELEAMIQADGPGGWFWLLGHRDGHAYAVEHHSTNKSGHRWIISEFLRSTLDLDSEVEINRLEWKGTLPLRMSVRDKKLNLQVGDARLARDHALPNYSPGDLLLGTHDTQYGARDVRVFNLRLRRAAEPVVKKAP
jgi:hypothetical protein